MANDRKKKLATVRTEEIITDYMQRKRALEDAKEKYEVSRDELKAHLVSQYGRGVQVISKVFTMVCWVYEAVLSGTVHRVRPKTFDKLVVRDPTKAELALVAKAWNKEFKKE